MNEPDIDQVALRWLADTVTWEARLHALRIRAELSATGHWTSAPPERREHLIAVASGYRPSTAGWDEQLDRSA